VLFFVTQSLQTTGNAFSEAYMEESMQDAAPMTILSAVAGIFAFASTVASTYFLCAARRSLRTAEDIPEGGCGPCDDCCVSYWCGCCSLTQMFRHYKVTGENYRPCTVSGEQFV
jgi:Cys-rich protein (TIGR01571 family)